MHSLKINVNSEAYSHLMYILQNIPSVEVIEDKIIKNYKKNRFLQRVKESDNDIKSGRVSDFNFNSFIKEIDDV